VPYNFFLSFFTVRTGTSPTIHEEEGSEKASKRIKSLRKKGINIVT
jgi:hypothetical protein